MPVLARRVIPPQPPTLQRVRAAHHKQLALFWNPLAPASIGVVWRSSAFPSAVDASLESLVLRDRPAAVTATPSKKKGGKKGGEAPAPAGPWSVGVCADHGTADDNAVATAAQVLLVTENILACGAGLVLDVTL